MEEISYLKIENKKMDKEHDEIINELKFDHVKLATKGNKWNNYMNISRLHPWTLREYIEKPQKSSY